LRLLQSAYLHRAYGKLAAYSCEFLFSVWPPAFESVLDTIASIKK